MENEKYSILWLIFVNIKAQEGHKFADLIDLEDNDLQEESYKGAWANIIVKADTINEALDVVPQGLEELGFEVVFIDKIENIMSLIDDGALNENVIEESDWLLNSDYIFKISDKLFPYM